MTLIIPHVPPNMHPAKRMRRSATTVMAGHFDFRPYRPRDVLTSLLNGVGPYLVEDREEEERLNKRQQRREKEKQKLAKERAVRAAQVGNAVAGPSISAPVLPVAREQSHSYTSRPSIQINTLQRSLSVTPPPITALEPPSSPDSTPGPSNSSSTSRTSSKRPRTPEDYETIEMVFPTEPKPKKKRIAHRKGWKGWVEGSPPPSEKLINLDAVPILQERRTRSGKNFDAIGVGKDGWV